MVMRWAVHPFQVGLDAVSSGRCLVEEVSLYLSDLLLWVFRKLQECSWLHQIPPSQQLVKEHNLSPTNQE